MRGKSRSRDDPQVPVPRRSDQTPATSSHQQLPKTEPRPGSISWMSDAFDYTSATFMSHCCKEPACPTVFERGGGGSTKAGG
eukprot:946305-Prorocentrum_lima.AAC.1